MSPRRWEGTRDKGNGYNRAKHNGYQSQMWKANMRDNREDEILLYRRTENKKHTAICNAYTQVLLNPMQLSDEEFAAWIGRIVDARRMRLEKKQQPFKDVRKEYH